MTRNGHTLEYMDFLKRLGVHAKPKNQVNKEGKMKKMNLIFNYPGLVNILFGVNIAFHWVNRYPVDKC